MCLMSSCKGIDIWLEIVSAHSSEKYKLLLQNSSRRNGLLRWDFKVHIRSRSSSTPSRVPLTPRGRYGPLWLPLF
ncbi:hypothetical protein T08_3518 [Trichinella sp. T8]|nr:hypothetical protein T08_3518 [Trichinella sp. T8]